MQTVKLMADASTRDRFKRIEEGKIVTDKQTKGGKMDDERDCMEMEPWGFRC